MRDIRTPWICKKIIDDGRVPSLPYKRPMGHKELMKPNEYVYDEYYDCVICPYNQVLRYTTTTREGYREFKSEPFVCKNCPKLSQCTNNKSYQKIVIKHIWMDYLELAEDYRHTKKYKDLYKKRQETIERVFADAKEKLYSKEIFYFRIITTIHKIFRTNQEKILLYWVY